MTDQPNVRCVSHFSQIIDDSANFRSWTSPGNEQNHFFKNCIAWYLGWCNKLVSLAGLMPYTAKDPKYLRDPKLFDPFKRQKWKDFSDRHFLDTLCFTRDNLPNSHDNNTTVSVVASVYLPLGSWCHKGSLLKYIMLIFTIHCNVECSQ